MQVIAEGFRMNLRGEDLNDGALDEYFGGRSGPGIRNESIDDEAEFWRLETAAISLVAEILLQPCSSCLSCIRRLH